MQFRDLKKQYSVLKTDIDKAIIDVAGSSQYVNGPWGRALEAELSDYVGVKYCITFANGIEILSNAKRNPLSQTRKWFMNYEPITRDTETNPLVRVEHSISDCSQVTGSATTNNVFIVGV